MPTGVEYIREVCKKNKIAISSLEKACGFANGYLNPKKASKIPYERALQIAEFMNSQGVSIDMNSILGAAYEEPENGERYYLNDETAAMAQELFENKELRVLFDAARTASPEDLKATYDILLALKRKERGYIDDTGC